MSGSLSGQVAIVTGGGRGIGQAIAKGLADAGASVSVVARTESQLDDSVSLIQRGGGVAVGMPADVTDLRALRRVVAETESLFGPVTLLVNNAGVIGPLGPIWEVDEKAWRDCIDVNLLGPFFGAQAVLPGMVRRRHGRIINLSTGAAASPMSYASAYSASKTALVRMTESMALESKPHGISVFSITPGLVRTAMPESIANSEAGKKWLPRFSSGILDNAISAERPANLCVLLASGVADVLSGRFLSVNDDLSALIGSVGQIEQDKLYTLGIKLLG